MKIQKINKKGNVTAKVALLIGMLIVVVMTVAIAPTLFNGTNNISGAPAWFGTIFPILIAAGLVFLVWRAVGGHSG